MESIKESYNLTSDEARQMENWLHVAEEPFRFTIVAPGEKSSNGGEYGFWEEWVPIPNLPGLYRVYTETSCDFDSCGTGFEGVRLLTEQDYIARKAESDKVEANGSLY
ncbi:MAG: hypothetical protein EOM59_19470 [Clostridia bacterium]|nr:hypothetical protein [Clostridia bacterium]